MTAAKQVVYVDVDDEITAIIDKVNNADARVVALVLPKRASVFQSIVNMKLLKRRAEQANKHLVLITSETGLMPLAGLAGMYVAQTLQSKPEIPAAPDDSEQTEDIDDEPVAMSSSDDNFSAKNAATPVGTLAAGAGAAGINSLPDDMQELNTASPASKGRVSPEMAAVAANASKNGSNATAKNGKKFSIPNFFAFRKRLIFIGLGVVALSVMWYFAWFVMPTASVSIKTKTTDLPTNINLTLDTDATAVDTEAMALPAKIQQQQKDNTQQAPATGTENKGNRATGTVTLTNCSQDNEPAVIPAGTGISVNNLTYLTQTSASLPTSAPDRNGNCRDLGAVTTAKVEVVAQKPGANYNVAASTFAVAGFASVQAKSEAAMSGGTDNNVKVVQQSDIDAAKQKMASSADKDTIKKALQKTIEDNDLYAVQSTFLAVGGNVITSAKVGDEAEAVTVSETTTYTMYGVKKADLRKLIEFTAGEKIDKSKQSIIDDGLSAAKFSVDSPAASPTLQIMMSVLAVAGPQIDIDQVKADMVGKKTGVVKDAIKNNPGVEAVEVKYSPFWVTKAPKPAKTTVVFEKSADSTTAPSTDSSGAGTQDEADNGTDGGSGGANE